MLLLIAGFPGMLIHQDLLLLNPNNEIIWNDYIIIILSTWH